MNGNGGNGLRVHKYTKGRKHRSPSHQAFPSSPTLRVHTPHHAQIFTRPIGDRPTLFLEIIQRVGCTRYAMLP